MKTQICFASMLLLSCQWRIVSLQLVQLKSCQASVCFHRLAEVGRLIILNVCAIPLANRYS